MAKQVKFYIDKNVYEEAKNRIRHIVDIFDSVIVSFSGGKDSLVVLNLVEEVYKEKGIKEKVKVFFLDEEVIPNSVVEFVQKIYESGRYDFRYYALPMRSEKYILGKTYEYIQWDRNRDKHMRTLPPYAITTLGDDSHIYSQYETDNFVANDCKGKVAMLLGIRADESIIRLKSCLTKKNENYICASTNERVKKCKPIFDWSEQDIFLYFYKNKINYCPVYDIEMSNAQQLRVATPLIANSAKRFDKVRTLDPEFYQGIMDIFPEMKLQELYYKSLDKERGYENYEHTIDGVLRYIDDTQDADAPKARRLILIAWKRRNNFKTPQDPFGGYPLRYLFDAVRRSGFSHMKGGLPLCVDPKISDYEFENLNYKDYEKL